MMWHHGRLIGFDLETTAKEPEEARIVTAAVAQCGGEQPLLERCWIADPGIEIPEEAAGIHGITTERARAEGRPAVQVVTEIVEMLRLTLEKGAPLVVFNARYDLTVLDREVRRHGDADVGIMDLLGWFPVIDPLIIDKHLNRYRTGSRKLGAICAHLGAKLEDAHSAADDAIAAARTAWVLAEKGEIVRRAWNNDMELENAALRQEWATVRGDLKALHEIQVVWAREQAEGLAEHFRETGKDDPGRVRTEWPVIPAG